MTEMQIPSTEDYKAELRADGAKIRKAMEAMGVPDADSDIEVVTMVTRANHGPITIEAASLVCAVLDVTGTRELGEEGRNTEETWLDYVAGVLAEANLT